MIKFLEQNQTYIRLPKHTHLPIDYDTQWKEIITSLFQDFIAFFLPKAFNLIDFSFPIEFLEQELHQILSDKYKKGKVINDKLVKVYLKDGQEKWILIHIEVQSSYESDFSERMFTYFYRIYDRYQKQITAIAIYTGDKLPSSYDKYEYKFLGTENIYKFNTYKIKSVSEKELLQSSNPFALVVLASKYLLSSQEDYNKRYKFKHRLIALSRERDYKDHQIISLLRFIDLLLKLPKELELKFETELIEKYIKPKEMVLRKSDRFANQLHLALYGETLAEKIKKETIMEKTLIVRNLLLLNKLTISQIADAINETIDFVEKVKEKLKK